MKRLIRHLHLWLAVPLGLVISVVCLSGAMLVYEHDIDRLLHPQLFHIESQGRAPLPLSQLLASAQAAAPEGAKVAGFTLSPDPDVPLTVDLSKPHHATVVIDQYTGQVIGQGGKLEFFSTITKLHRRLFDSPTTASGNPSFGKLIVGISVILFILTLITGVILWWPNSRRQLATSLKIPLRQGSRRFWFALHDAGGIYALILLLAMALTGLTYSFRWYTNAFFAVLGEDAATIPRGKMSKLQDGQKAPAEADFAVWQQVATDIAERYPDRQLSFSPGAVKVKVRSGNHRAADEIAFDPTTGQITNVTLYTETKRIARLRGWVYSVHSGQWLGGLGLTWLSKLLNFLAALIGATLPLTGYWLWLRRK